MDHESYSTFNSARFYALESFRIAPLGTEFDLQHNLYRFAPWVLSSSRPRGTTVPRAAKMSACVASRVNLIRRMTPSTPWFARRVPVPVPRAAHVRVRAESEVFGVEDAGKPDEKVIVEPRYVPVARPLRRRPVLRTRASVARRTVEPNVPAASRIFFTRATATVADRVPSDRLPPSNPDWKE